MRDMDWGFGGQSHNEFEMNDENAVYYVWSENRENGAITTMS